MYTLTLTATVDGVTATHDIELTIEDPCESSTFVVTPGSIDDITVEMPQTGVQTRTFTITTDAELANPGVVCSFAVTDMLPAMNFISYDPTTRTITVDESLITMPDEIGTHPFTVSVNSVEYPGTVDEVLLPFDVIIKCEVGNFAVVQAPQDVE